LHTSRYSAVAGSRLRAAGCVDERQTVLPSGQLQRRNVLRAAAFYAASGWLVVQVATQVFPFFHIDEAVVRWIVIAAIVGLPFALVFAWFYELTPQGVVRESEIDRSASITANTGKKLDKAIIAVLALAVILLLLNQFVLHRFIAGIPLQQSAANRSRCCRSITCPTTRATPISPAASRTKS
jgi:hypothetical protein